jgi:hypothetical protein
MDVYIVLKRISDKRGFGSIDIPCVAKTSKEDATNWAEEEKIKLIENEDALRLLDVNISLVVIKMNVDKGEEENGKVPAD